ncbi:MAG: cytochrome c [Pseudomonadota bacterium]
MRRLLVLFLAFVALMTGVGLWLTQPKITDPVVFQDLTPDIANGALIFAAAGCASCHSNVDTKEGLAGGHAFVSAFGTFYAPNISQDTTYGIGSWSVENLANAMIHGTSPGGTHYYPAFPYTSYANTEPQDILDLFAYLRTTTAEPIPSIPHDVGFPFDQRWTLGGWKLLFVTKIPVLDAGANDQLLRGRYLVETLGHCAECHTPRNALGAVKRSQWLAGAPNPSGSGTIPNIRASDAGIGAWSEDEIVEYFQTGFTPDFDVVGGSMASVQENLAKLPESDLRAIVAYLKSLPAL